MSWESESARAWENLNRRDSEDEGQDKEEGDD